MRGRSLLLVDRHPPTSVEGEARQAEAGGKHLGDLIARDGRDAAPGGRLLGESELAPVTKRGARAVIALGADDQAGDKRRAWMGRYPPVARLQINEGGRLRREAVHIDPLTPLLGLEHEL